MVKQTNKQIIVYNYSEHSLYGYIQLVCIRHKCDNVNFGYTVQEEVYQTFYLVFNPIWGPEGTFKDTIFLV